MRASPRVMVGRLIGIGSGDFRQALVLPEPGGSECEITGNNGHVEGDKESVHPNAVVGVVVKLFLKQAPRQEFTSLDRKLDTCLDLEKSRKEIHDSTRKLSDLEVIRIRLVIDYQIKREATEPRNQLEPIDVLLSEVVQPEVLFVVFKGAPDNFVFNLVGDDGL